MRISAPAILLLPLVTALPLGAQDAKPAADSKPPEAPKRRWSDKASLSFVATGGNAKSQTFGFSNEYKYAWDHAALAFNAGAVRVSTTTTTRSAYGPDLNTVTVYETDATQVTTEIYFANLRYDHAISDGFQWYATAGWDRNRPSGIESRAVEGAGLSYGWVKTDRTKFRTDLGVGYTKITPVFETPDFVDSFATWNLGASFEKKLFETSLFTSSLALTDSLKDSRDYLAVWRNAFTTNLNKTLALKVGYDLNYKHRPAFVGVDVIGTPVATPPVVLGQTPVQLRKLDTVFTTSLVITF